MSVAAALDGFLNVTSTLCTAVVTSDVVPLMLYVEPSVSFVVGTP